MVKSLSIIPPSLSQDFAFKYGDSTKDLTYVSRTGNIKPIFASGLYLAIFSSIVCGCSFIGASVGKKGKSMLKTFFKVIAIFCLVVAIASMITYFFVYIRKIQYEIIVVHINPTF